MRPRHKAAENVRVHALGIHANVTASMRPRHKAAENDDDWTDESTWIKALQ